MRDRLRRDRRYAACFIISFARSQGQAVAVGLRRRSRRETALVALQREAIEIIELRIADGRPSPEVWRAAAVRQAAKGLPVDAWYEPTGVRPDRRGPVPAAPGAAPTVGGDLVLKVVTLPLVPSTAAAGRGCRRGASLPRAVAGASN